MLIWERNVDKEALLQEAQEVAMIAEPNFKYMTPQEYLDWENTQEMKHEYIDGEVLAMTGGTIPHNLISGNLYALLKSHHANGNCRPTAKAKF
jgi:Uma2 family endonuclease